VTFTHRLGRENEGVCHKGKSKSRHARRFGASAISMHIDWLI